MRKLTNVILAGAALLISGYVNPVNAGACDKAPPIGTKFQWTGPNQWKITTTVRQDLKSKNDRKIAFAYKKLDMQAQRELARFINTKVANANTLSTEEKAEFVVDGNDDVTKDSLEGFEEFIEAYGTSTEALLIGSLEIGRCNVPGVEVFLSRGIKSDTQQGARVINNPSSSSNNSNNSNKIYRSDVQQGYDGYGNFDDF